MSDSVGEWGHGPRVLRDPDHNPRAQRVYRYDGAGEIAHTGIIEVAYSGEYVRVRCSEHPSEPHASAATYEAAVAAWLEGNEDPS